MKVFIAIQKNPYFTNSASANRWIGLIEGLIKEGVEIELLIYNGYQNEAEAKDWRVSGNKNGLKYKYIKPILIKGYLKARYYKYIGIKIDEKPILKLIFNELKNSNHILWTDATFLSFKLAVYLKNKGVKNKLLLELNEFLDIHKYNNGYFIERLGSNKRQKYFEEKALYAYDGLALMTKTLMKHYQAFPKPIPQLLHLPMTADLERFQGPIELHQDFLQPYVAFVGVMGNAKDGVHILIEAFNNIHQNHPDLKLYLVGGWNYDTPSHLERIKELNLGERIKWMGSYSRLAIPSIICNASILALPRPNSKQAQGGFPTKLGEYLATGNPVCATAVGEIPDYLIDNESVYFAEPGSVESFTDAMKKALKDSEKSKAIGLKGKNVAELSFNKDIQSKLLHNFLKQL